MKKKFFFMWVNFLDKLRRVIRVDSFQQYFHKLILGYLKENYSNIINNYQRESTKGTINLDDLNSKAWTMWWQGLDNAPELVTKCISSIKVAFPDLVVITKDNYKEYIELTPSVISKFDKGLIKMPCFSDIIRFNLLSKYGGTWVDATVFIQNLSPNSILVSPYTSLKGSDFSLGKYVPRGRWRGFFQYGDKEFGVFCFGKDFFNQYWENESKLINFFLIDYILELAYQYKIADFNEIIDNSPLLGEDVYYLDSVLASGVPQKIPQRDNMIYKLSNKKSYSKKSKLDNNFYRFLNNELFD